MHKNGSFRKNSFQNKTNPSKYKICIKRFLPKKLIFQKINHFLRLLFWNFSWGWAHFSVITYFFIFYLDLWGRNTQKFDHVFYGWPLEHCDQMVAKTIFQNIWHWYNIKIVLILQQHAQFNDFNISIPDRQISQFCIPQCCKHDWQTQTNV